MKTQKRHVILVELDSRMRSSRESIAGRTIERSSFGSDGDLFMLFTDNTWCMLVTDSDRDGYVKIEFDCLIQRQEALRFGLITTDQNEEIIAYENIGREKQVERMHRATLAKLLDLYGAPTDEERAAIRKAAEEEVPF